MPKPVRVTKIALADLENVLSYLDSNWGLTVMENFLALYEAKVALVAEYPERYPIIHHKSLLRKAVLTRHNMILYRDKNDYIEIISIFDTRQDPGKINKLT